ncbi:hypothetical protein [Clostridium sp. YIM B02555]|uniref:hypothetical protein n=1 Tax=Clostridium sp. YIM B02555 TaxID=2911968 RepID=UPI001EEE8DDE
MNKVLKDAVDLLKMPDGTRRRAVNSIINTKYSDYSGVNKHAFNSVLQKMGKSKNDLTNYENLAVKKLLKNSNLRDITKEEVSKTSEQFKKDIDMQAKFKIGADWFKEPAKTILSSNATKEEKSHAKKQLALRTSIAAVGAIAAGKVLHDLDSKDTLLGQLGYSSKDAMHFAIGRIAKL